MIPAGVVRVGFVRFVRPSWPMVVISLLVFATLIGLGTWQIQRLGWKTQLIATREARINAPAITLAQALADPTAAEYRLTTLTGRFHRLDAISVGAATYHGETGQRLVAPFTDTNSGITVLVDRGWVPLGGAAAVAWPMAPVRVAGWGLGY